MVREPELRADGAPPTEGRLVTNFEKAWVYGAISFRWTRLRARSQDQPNFTQGLLWNLIPDVTAGMSPRSGNNAYLYAAGWPIILNRVYFNLGFGHYRQNERTPDYALGQRVSLSEPFSTFSKTRWRKELLFGFSVDLIATK